MVALLILIGLLVFAAVYAVAFLVMFVVAAVKVKKGSITQADLDKATEECRQRRAERKRRRLAGYHNTMRYLGFE
jgi:hypothetical protein